MLKTIDEKWNSYFDSFIGRHLLEILAAVFVTGVVSIIVLSVLVTRWLAVSSLETQLMLIRADGVEIKRQQAENTKRITDLENQQGWINTKLIIHREDLKR